MLIILALGYIIKNSVVTLSHNTSKSIVQCDNTKGIDLNAGQRDIQYISELKGQFFANPLLSICLTVCLFSMAGFNYTIIQLLNKGSPNSLSTRIIEWNASLPKLLGKNITINAGKPKLLLLPYFILIILRLKYKIIKGNQQANL